MDETGPHAGQDTGPGRHVHCGEAPNQEVAQRRRRAVLAGHHGEEATARGLLADPEAVVRAAAVGALERIGTLTDDELAHALTDSDPAVRRRALEVLGSTGEPRPTVAVEALLELLQDPDGSVVEVACWTAGEHPDLADDLVAPVVAVATGHDDPMCRESAVAALGALGHGGGRDAVLGGLAERASIRRRAVLALAAFEGPEVEAALVAALKDRDWQVRQAAEDLLGIEAPAKD